MTSQDALHQPSARLSGDFPPQESVATAARRWGTHGVPESSLMRAAVIAMAARYTRGGRIDVADETGVCAYDIDSAAPLSDLLTRHTTNRARVNVKAATIALIGQGGQTAVPALVVIQVTRNGFVVSSPGRRHDQASVEAMAVVIERFIDVLTTMATNDSPSTLTVSGVGLPPTATPISQRALGVGGDAAITVPQVHIAVANIALSDPDRIAIEDGDVIVTYRELAKAMMLTRRELLGIGAGPRTPVAVLMDRGIPSVVAQLAAFAAGCRVVLLDPALPASRIEYMLTDSGSLVLLVDDRDTEIPALDSLPDIPVIVPATGREESRPNVEVVSRAETLGPLPTDAVSHIAYTSGSTGEPKAVQLTHGAMSNTAQVLGEFCAMGPHSRGSWFCAPGVGMIEVDMFPILTAGGTVVVGPQKVIADPQHTRDWLRDSQVTHALVPTIVAEHLLRLDWPIGTTLTSLRIAGERLTVWPHPAVPFQVVNVYGSTEANVVTLSDVAALARPCDSVPPSVVPVGRPVVNVNVYVLDDELRPVPSHARGELCVSGLGLSRGYLRRAGEDAARFLPNPMANDDFPVLFRTGDLARVDSRGCLWILGRIDDEVKISGYRVHPNDIEVELSRIEGVAATAVLPRTRADGTLFLAAYVERTLDVFGAALDIPRIRRTLTLALPAHMIPSSIIMMDLPITRSGKIDRPALAARHDGHSASSFPYRAPRTDAERRIIELFTEVLALEGLGAEDHFLELGGSSLQAAALIRRIHEEFDTELSLSDVMESPTVAAIALLVS